MIIQHVTGVCFHQAVSGVTMDNPACLEMGQDLTQGTATHGNMLHAHSLDAVIILIAKTA
jgi:hypothetical protein